jgi:hypothetical protein
MGRALQSRRHRRPQRPLLAAASAAPADAGKREAYFDRFVFSQKFAQVDPWSERVSGKHKHEFKPMATFPLEAAE